MLITVSNRSGSYALPFQPGQTLLDALRQAGLPVSAPCGGRGTCGKCTVYLSTPDGERAVLACQTAAEDGMALRLLEEGPLAVELEGVEHPLPCPPDPEAAGWGLACDIGHHHRGVPSGGAVHRPHRRHLGGGQRPAALRRRCDRPHQGIYGRAAPSPHRRHPGSTIPDGRSALPESWRALGRGPHHGGGRQHHHVPPAGRPGPGQLGPRPLHPSVPVWGAVQRPGAGAAL